MSDIRINRADYINEYKLELEFNDGKIQVVDFAPFLNSSKHPEIREYLDVEKFKQFSIVDGDLDWGDFDLTFPIWDLYNNKILKSWNEELSSKSA